LTQDEWFTGYQMAVTDVMRIIDWAEQNSRINKAQISVIALSLGAIVGSIAMGLDKRIKAGVFMVQGGNTGKIMQTNSVSRFGKQFRQSPDIYMENQKKYLEYLNEITLNGFNNVLPEQKTYLIDPLTYAAMLKRQARINDKRTVGRNISVRILNRFPKSLRRLQKGGFTVIARQYLDMVSYYCASYQ